MYKIVKFNQKKMAKRRRKLRSLVPKESIEINSSRSINSSMCGTFLIFVLIGAIYYSNLNTSVMWEDFWVTYRNQYNQIAHGAKDYCVPTIDTGKLFAQISCQVLNQPLALASIELHIKNESRFTAIAVVGTSGVGKSLFAQSLKEHFPWKENVQLVSWSAYRTLSQEHEKLLTIPNYLSKCGRNLIIIDNFHPEDIHFVNEYNTYLGKLAQEANVNLIAMYVFNMLTYTAEQREQYSDRMDELNLLENAEIVGFRKFDSNDIKDCIRFEAKLLNLTLDAEGFDEVFKSINTGSSGCKNVHSKVLMYGLRDD